MPKSDSTTKAPSRHDNAGSASESTQGKTEGKTEPEASRKGIDWADPKVLAGNAPKMSSFPLVLAVFAWLSWIVFLVVLLLTRTDLATI